MAEAQMQTPEFPNEYWSLNRASKELGINKSTLSNDASKGKIQWHDQKDGTKKFFVPELYSFYAERLRKRTERAERTLNVVTGTGGERDKTGKNNELNTALEAKGELIEALKAQIEDLRHDRDQWQRQAEVTGRQLTEAMETIKALPAPANSNQEAPKRKKFLGIF